MKELSVAFMPADRADALRTPWRFHRGELCCAPPRLGQQANIRAGELGGFPAAKAAV
jgi:hypothetical protein